MAIVGEPPLEIMTGTPTNGWIEQDIPEHDEIQQGIRDALLLRNGVIKVFLDEKMFLFRCYAG